MNPLSHLLQRRRDRRAYSDLLALDDRLLRDIGLTRNDIHRVMDGHPRTDRFSR